MKKLNGVRLSHHKGTAACQTVRLPLPEKVTIPMLMNMGAPCTPLVKLNDNVKAGQKIGDTDAFMSVPVHSSVSGKVTSVADMKLANGNVCKAVTIETDGQQTVSEEVVTPDIHSKEEFIKALRESGLTGLGGAGFPTHIKLNPQTPVDILIINAAECEPYITSDHRQMLEDPDSVIDGILTVMKYLEIEKAVIGIEDNKQDAISLMTEKTASHPEISVMALPSSYPQGAEKVLIYNTTGRIVMEGQLPSDAGAVVMNVSTAAQISHYMKNGIPLTERRVTVDGDIVGKPCNVLVPIGTPFSKVLEFAQCDTEKLKKLIAGGPMMGACAFDPETPVVKGTNAILAFEKYSEPTVTNCIRCGRCIKACPLNLMPTEMEKAYHKRDVETLKALKVNLCMNCGCCTYACPAGRKLAETNQLAKMLIPRN
ncbi:MAG: electron transport complex subunit RsxC [Clostridium sp.]|nr:electron transport complex subunit RsxC [Clostridium sp.]MCM1548184.1 electron transport complex subunit RsxC [Ruminococcus sp.]